MIIEVTDQFQQYRNFDEDTYEIEEVFYTESDAEGQGKSLRSRGRINDFEVVSGVMDGNIGDVDVAVLYVR